MNKTEIAKLLLAHREALHKYACSLTWDWHKADDLVQDTAVKILLNADKYNPVPGSSFFSWACLVMRRMFLNNLKYEQHQLPMSQLAFEPDDAEPFANKYFTSRAGDSTINVCDATINVSDIYRLIDNLPGDTGKVMHLYIVGYKYVEIAHELDIPLGTVKTHIHLSREILKRLLKDYLD